MILATRLLRLSGLNHFFPYRVCERTLTPTNERLIVSKDANERQNPYDTRSTVSQIMGKRSTLKASIFAVLIALFINTPNFADDYIVLEGFLGPYGQRWMKEEVDALRCQGHNVDHRAFWRWRSAVRDANGPVNIIGYSLGCHRAVLASERVCVKHLELVDPFRNFGKVKKIPSGVPTTVYRASCPKIIKSVPVQGCYQERYIPTDHFGMPRHFRQY